MINPARLSLPEGFELSDRDYDVYDRLAATPLETYVDEMPDKQEVSLSDGTVIKVVDLPGDDSSEAIAVNLPYGNDYSPAMHIRMVAMQGLLPEPKRVLVFPNNTSQSLNYGFGMDGLHPNKAPAILAEKMLEASARAGVEKLHVAGVSQGASIGAFVLRTEADRFDVSLQSATLIEPADVAERTPAELAKAFRGTGLGELNQAINDSGIRALTGAQISWGGLSSIYQAARFTGVYLNSRLPENAVLHKSLAKDTFVGNVAYAAERGALPARSRIIRMAGSLVCTEQLDADLEKAGLESLLQVVDGYGHEGPDNVMLNGLLVRNTIEPALPHLKVA